MNENEENKNPDPKDNSQNPFSLPGDYFNSFSQKMMRKIELAEELKEFRILSSIDKKLPFVTPDRYFEKSAKVKTELAPYETLSALNRQNAFAVPELYFETSAKALQHKAEWADELAAYPALAAFEKQDAFTVPAGYFDSLGRRVREKIGEEGQEQAFGRVIQLVFSKKTAYALAAMLVLSLGLWFFNRDSAVIVPSGDCHTLACLDKKDVLKGGQLINMDDENLMEIVNADELVKKLSEEEKPDDKKQKEDYVIENADVNDIVDGI